MHLILSCCHFSKHLLTNRIKVRVGFNFILNVYMRMNTPMHAYSSFYYSRSEFHSGASQFQPLSVIFSRFQTFHSVVIEAPCSYSVTKCMALCKFQIDSRTLIVVIRLCCRINWYILHWYNICLNCMCDTYYQCLCVDGKVFIVRPSAENQEENESEEKT